MIENLINFLKADEFLIGVFEKKIHIFNYRKIIDINVDKITVLVKDKKIEVKGQSLTIKKLDKNEILINGNIKRVDLID